MTAMALISSSRSRRFRIADARRAEAHAETQILRVSELRLDGPAPGIEVDDFARRRPRIARRQMPGVLHAFGVDADDRANSSLLPRDFGVRQLFRARPPVPTQSLARRVSRLAAETKVSPRKRIT